MNEGGSEGRSEGDTAPVSRSVSSPDRWLGMGQNIDIYIEREGGREE